MTNGVDLCVEQLDVRYGALQALSGLDLCVPAGSVTAVLGPNGAGKTTFGRAVSGLVPVKSGHVRLGDTETTNWTADRLHRAGLAYIPEGRGIFPGLSVVDNLRMAVRHLSPKSARTSRPCSAPSTSSRSLATAPTSWPAASPEASSRCWGWRERLW